MSNGLVESFNGTLRKMLKRVCAERPRDWHQCLEPLLFCYREVPQESTGFAPFELMYGRDVRGPLAVLKECLVEDENKEEISVLEYVFELNDRIRSTMEVVQENLVASHQRSKNYYDIRSVKQDISIGDEVLLLLPKKINKLVLHWRGPYKVIGNPFPSVYQMNINGKVRTYHVNMLKRYYNRD